MSDLELVHPEAGRQKDPLWDALMEACSIDTTSITTHARGAYNRSVEQLRRVKATPRDVRERAEAYKLRFPHSALTPPALCRHWAECRPHRNGPICPEHGVGRCYFHPGTGWAHAV